MEKRIQEARNCLDNGLYEVALTLVLTLPDICGQAEYPVLKKVDERYTKWIDDFVDSKVLYDQFFDAVGDFKHLESQDIYKLRCVFLHSGDQNISNDTIDCFNLVRPDGLGAEEGKASFGYKYGIENQPDGSVKNTAQIDIKYLTEMICNAAGKYYKSKSPTDFEEHTFKLI
jgi:hypothetical protein